LIVMKFGGSSVADAERILRTAEIVRARLERRPVVVVSALGGVTDLLVGAVEAARQGDLEGLEPRLADLERRHRWALAGCIDARDQRHDLSLETDRQFEDLRQKLRSVRILGEGTPRAVDAILAIGELLAARIVTAVFHGRGLAARLVDPRRLLVTDDRHGEADPRLEFVGERCALHLQPLIEAGQVPVVGGFVGATPAGETTTLGRGGSDTSAAVIGSVMQAAEIQIWTDVDGLMSADPRLVPTARTIPRLSFAEAAELAFYGAKVLHPDSIAPAVRCRIPVRVLNASRPEGHGSVILDADPQPSAGGLVSVASRSGVLTLRVLSRRMKADPGFVAGVIDGLRANRLTPDLIVASEVAVHFALPRPGDTARLVREMERFGTVELREDRAIICAVGSGAGGGGPSGRLALTALAEWEPELVGVGASGTGLAAIVPRQRLEAAVRGLHRQFFE
jgi:aspartate kinase